ncbi:pyocin activator PrtN family protein [Halotalea alkalilenta]|uniref:pyocin activator PrtN family protein n=1 Tax=Halotalea alkalilenta TaxID=376489 RepID=UPI0009DCD7B6
MFFSAAWSATQRTVASRPLAQRLPVPAYRAVRSQKAPWLVNVADLATYLDECREQAMRDWQKMNE